jgi:GH15 family glucan-1,4-alpha-glucosidase
VPIQEDETALVIWALWRHYDKSRDIEFVHYLYRNLIVRCADFMVGFRREDLNLPAPSWNLWEDRRGIHTFTCATVVAGLRAAANFARLFGEADRAALYDETANETVEAIAKHLYSPEHGRFLRSLQFNNGDEFEKDATVDASLFGVFYFGCFAPEDEMVVNTMKAVEEKLWVNAEIGGIARYENDNYMRVSQEFTGNAWFTCTLWLAEYYIAKNDLPKALEILEWTVKRALPSGVLGEQVNPLTGEQVSVSPLTWSHSTFVATVLSYLEKLRTF